MAIFNSYVKLPEGIFLHIRMIFLDMIYRSIPLPRDDSDRYLAESFSRCSFGKASAYLALAEPWLGRLGICTRCLLFSGCNVISIYYICDIIYIYTLYTYIHSI